MNLTRLKKVRSALADAQDGRCCYCRRPFGEGDLACTLEHRRPKMNGGTDDIDNLAAACWHCNRNRGIQMHRAKLLNSRKAAARAMAIDNLAAAKTALVAALARYREARASLKSNEPV